MRAAVAEKAAAITKKAADAKTAVVEKGKDALAKRRAKQEEARIQKQEQVRSLVPFKLRDTAMFGKWS